jgi:DNA-binding GntR family transcriptional regulator
MNTLMSRSNTLADDAYEQIRHRILDNLWPPGHRALEQEVCLALGMSRTPVREALVRLQVEGLIDLIPRHGMHVLPVSATQMAEIYEVLTALECLAVETLTKRKPNTQDIAALIHATDAMERALAANNRDDWAQADELFHAELIELAGNKTLKSAVMSVWDRAHRARMFSLQARPLPIDSTRKHRALVKKILAGDVLGAVQENKAHRERASKELLEIFARFNIPHM